MLSVLETPSRKRLSVSRQTLSPMECSTNGFNSSGIEVRGDALPDISPIKLDRGNNFAQKMDIFNDAEDVENANNSVDDGGPLEVSALSTEDNFSHHDAKEKEESDNEMAPGITMEDLASDVDFMRDDSGDKGSNSSKVKIEVSSPKENSVDEKPFQSVVDGSIGTRMSAEHFKAPKEIRIDGEDVDSNHNHSKFSGVIEDKQSKLGKETFGNSHDQASRKAWQTSDYRSIGSPMKDCHFCELDEDIIVMRARAALRRANRHSSMDNSLSLSDLSLNRSSAWEPIRMSTPLVPQDSLEYTNNQYYADGDGNLGYSSASRSHDHFDAFFGRESWHRERGQDMTSHHYHHSISTKPVSAVEDIIRQRKVQKKLEGKYGLSSSWRKSSSPLYESKWRLSRTHPMSHLEWKALYWRPPSQRNHWRDKHWYSTDPFEADLARLSCPPRPNSSKLIHGSRPLSPPVNFPPAKVPRAVFTGYVSKMPIPYYQDSSDSGYSDWQQSTGQWEGTMRGHHSLLGTPRAGIRYY